MKVIINTENYHRFDVMELGKLPPRSYLIPYETREKADAVLPIEKRYASAKVQCLNGDWDFRFYANPNEMPIEFDSQVECKDKIDVPSCIQFRGYDRPFYVNTRYQFPYKPPEIPQLKPVGKTFSWIGSDYGIFPRYYVPSNEYNFVAVYRRSFTVSKAGHYILSFLGVSSCLDLYVNGFYVGYSEGSHNTAEFDLTDILQPGENEILAVVHRWCNGTYLECQDMFRNTGIFRDVLLYQLEETDIWDTEIKTRKAGETYELGVHVTLLGEGKVTVTLSGHGIQVTKTVETKNHLAKVTFRNLEVAEWSAEIPVLYDLYLETETGCVKERVGFKRVEIQKDVFTINGQKVKLHGVNHHDTSCINGYTMTPEEIERDIKLCKEYHVDTVRTSHYPPDPLFLELCDEYGIYVVDEADQETHGVFSHRLPPSYNQLTQDPAWENRYLDRAKRLYGRDKNHISIILWSLGNESGGYRNTDVMYRFLKSRSQIPVHYESVIHSKRKAYDVGSEMYPSLEKVQKVADHCRKEKELNDRPYFLCEYAHAMGVGPGNMEAYWEKIYAYDNLMGGCVWEMVDHAVLHEDGRYTYGGDHKEWEHDGNFCVDGLFYPDRSPSTGAKIMKFVYRPIRVSYLGDDCYEIWNTRGFRSTEDVEFTFVFTDGREISQKIIAEPLSKKTVSLPDCAPLDSESVIVKILDKEKRTLLSEEQIRFKEFTSEPVQVTEKLPDWFRLEGTKVVGEIQGKRLEMSDPYTILYRASTDNDMTFALTSRIGAFQSEEEQIRRVEEREGEIRILSELTCQGHKFLCADSYRGCEEGVLVTSHLRCLKGKGNLPRFGKAFRLPETFEQVIYKGRRGESYCDMKDQFPVEEVTCQVKDMTEPNIRPQESGNRSDCEYVILSDGETKVKFRALHMPFELGVKPYTDQALMKMKHREDEVATGTYVTISAFMMGIGTGSCGPATAREYCYPAEEEYQIQFVISME